MRRIVFLGLVLTAVACARAPRGDRPAAEGDGERAQRVSLDECGSTNESCLVLEGVSSVGEHAVLESGSSFGRSPLTWLKVGSSPTTTQSRVLLLFDVSGSMQGQGIMSARAAVAAFLTDLPGTWNQVAVAPFESHNVAARIRAAVFSSPEGARQSLVALPKPGGNTALYSAIDEGARVLAAGRTGVPLHLVVVTDGVNDIRRGDDAGLLTGPEGLQTAVAAAAEAGVSVWTIGVGKEPREDELTALAGSSDRAQIVATDPVALSRALTRIVDHIGTNTRLLVGVDGAARAGVGRGAAEDSRGNSGSDNLSYSCW